MSLPSAQLPAADEAGVPLRSHPAKARVRGDEQVLLPWLAAQHTPRQCVAMALLSSLLQGKDALQDTWRAMEELKRIGVVTHSTVQ